jgi:hypothetical protein
MHTRIYAYIHMQTARKSALAMTRSKWHTYIHTYMYIRMQAARKIGLSDDKVKLERSKGVYSMRITRKDEKLVRAKAVSSLCASLTFLYTCLYVNVCVCIVHFFIMLLDLKSTYILLQRN